MNRLIGGLAPGYRLARLLLGTVVLSTALIIAGCSLSPEPDSPGTPPRFRLITTQQYRNSLAYIFGPSVSLDVQFPPPKRTRGLLANGTALAGITDTQLELFQRSAASVAAQVVDTDHRRYLMPCEPASDTAADDACATEFLAHTGRLLYRRAMSDTEIDKYVHVAGIAADKLKDFYAGLSLALEGMLVSPGALFIVEHSEPDPDQPGKQRLDAYSLASRLSFFLWNAGPDDQLLKAAESGALQTEKGRARAVDRMLASPRLEAGMRAFFDDMFAFDDFDTLAKDPAVYPFFTDVMASDAREQTLRTAIDLLITRKGDYRDLFTTRSTFITPALAAIYGVSAPPGWSPYDFPADSPRVGLLTQVSFLSLHAHPGRSSPTRRGKALRELLLCQVVPPPPPNVDFSALTNPDARYKTQRERVAVHLKNPACAGCHKIMDPIGLALERFNGAGRYRATENGAAIDTSGNLDGKEFDDVVGLAQTLHDNPALPNCLVQRLYSYAAGGPTSTADRPLLQYLDTRFEKHDYRVPELLRTIALSDAFSRISGGQNEIPADDKSKAIDAPVQQTASNQH